MNERERSTSLCGSNSKRNQPIRYCHYRRYYKWWKFCEKLWVTVAITGQETSGIAVCNQIRSFDIETRTRMGTIHYVETLDDYIINDIVNKVVSVIDPA